MTEYPEPAGGLFDGCVHRYALRVYYEDTDAGGIVYHANYLRWFERARSDMLRLLGIDQRAALESGEGGYAIADLAIRFRAPARLGDAVLIETRTRAIGAASVRMEQLALRGQVRLCDADLRIGFIGPDGQARRQPPEWRARFHPLLDLSERQT